MKPFVRTIRPLAKSLLGIASDRSAERTDGAGGGGFRLPETWLAGRNQRMQIQGAGLRPALNFK